MLSGLRVAHRLLLIYLLSFASVAYLAYTLVAEKNIAIEFARKELRGIGYVDVVRQSLVSIIRSREAAVPQAGITAATIRTCRIRSQRWLPRSASTDITCIRPLSPMLF